MNMFTRCRWTVLPGFHLPIDWTQRLAMADAARAWQPVTVEQVPMLVERPGSTEVTQAMALFVLPGHLVQQAWDYLGKAAELGASADGFDSFVGGLSRFLEFKGLQVPRAAVADLIIQGEEREIIRWPAGNEGEQMPWAVINLGQGLAYLTVSDSRVLPVQEELVGSIGHEAGALRVALAAGEGVRLPSGLAACACGMHRLESGVLLQIRAG